MVLLLCGSERLWFLLFQEESPSEQELRALKQTLADTQPVGCVVECCKTMDQVGVAHVVQSPSSPTADSSDETLTVTCGACSMQAKAVLKFVEAISEKTLRSTVALTAARGRGKSAALGLAIASSVAFGSVRGYLYLCCTQTHISGSGRK